TSHGRDAATKELETFSSQIVDVDKRKSVDTILKALFPYAPWSHGSQRWSSGYSLVAERRIADPLVFDFYFQMAVPPSEISQFDVEFTLDGLHEPMAFIDRMLGLADEDRLGAFLRHLLANQELVPVGK